MSIPQKPPPVKRHRVAVIDLTVNAYGGHPIIFAWFHREHITDQAPSFARNYCNVTPASVARIRRAQDQLAGR